MSQHISILTCTYVQIFVCKYMCIYVQLCLGPSLWISADPPMFPLSWNCGNISNIDFPVVTRVICLPALLGYWSSLFCRSFHTLPVCPSLATFSFVTLFFWPFPFVLIVHDLHPVLWVLWSFLVWVFLLPYAKTPFSSLTYETDPGHKHTLVSRQNKKLKCV